MDRRNRKVSEENVNQCIQEELFQENEPIEAWRIFKIIAEFVTGFEALQRYSLAVSFFGTSRCQFGDKVYLMATELAGRLSKEGYTIITGGGGGVMEAANRGAKEGGGKSVGLNIHLPNEQTLNDYTTESVSFHYFFTRKVMLSFASEVYVFFPGGFGTLDEFFEIITLVQTEKIKPLPIILIGRDYWEPLLSWIESDLCAKYKAIDKKDMDIYQLTETVDEAFEAITKSVRFLGAHGSS